MDRKNAVSPANGGVKSSIQGSVGPQACAASGLLPGILRVDAVFGAAGQLQNREVAPVAVPRIESLLEVPLEVVGVGEEGVDHAVVEVAEIPFHIVVKIGLARVGVEEAVVAGVSRPVLIEVVLERFEVLESQRDGSHGGGSVLGAYAESWSPVGSVARQVRNENPRVTKVRNGRGEWI